MSDDNQLTAAQETHVRVMIWKNLAIAIVTFTTLLGSFSKCYIDSIVEDANQTIQIYEGKLDEVDKAINNKINGYEELTIGLLSDFGSQSYYVGKLRAAILKENPNANLIDISHNIKDFDIVEGGWTLYNAAKSFKEGSIFLAIVNPGANLEKSILIETKSPKYYFIGADKKLFDYVAVNFGVEKTCHISLTNKNDTFGTSTFSKIVNLLIDGQTIEKLVELNNVELSKKEFEPTLEPAINNFKKISESQVTGYICAIDKWGNLITNINADSMEDFFVKGTNYSVTIKGTTETKDTTETSFVFGKKYEDGKLKNGVILRQDEWIQVATYKKNTAKRFAIESAGGKITITKE